jgi:hypothetical protein
MPSKDKSTKKGLSLYESLGVTFRPTAVAKHLKKYYKQCGCVDPWSKNDTETSGLDPKDEDEKKELAAIRKKHNQNAVPSVGGGKLVFLALAEQFLTYLFKRIIKTTKKDKNGDKSVEVVNVRMAVANDASLAAYFLAPINRYTAGTDYSGTNSFGDAKAFAAFLDNMDDSVELSGEAWNHVYFLTNWVVNEVARQAIVILRASSKTTVTSTTARLAVEGVLSGPLFNDTSLMKLVLDEADRLEEVETKHKKKTAKTKKSKNKKSSDDSDDSGNDSDENSGDDGDNSDSESESESDPDEDAGDDSGNDSEDEKASKKKKGKSTKGGKKGKGKKGKSKSK